MLLLWLALKLKINKNEYIIRTMIAIQDANHWQL